MELDFNNPNPLIATLARLFAAEGCPKEVAILAHTEAEIIQNGYSSSDGPYYFNLILQIPYRIFSQLEPELDTLQGSIEKKAELILRAYPKLESAKFSVRHFGKMPKSLALKAFQRL